MRGILRSIGHSLFGISILMSPLGCERKATPPSIAAPNLPGCFSIQEIDRQIEASGEKKIWLATAVQGEKTARFRIELVLKPPKGDSPFTITVGALMREKGSNGDWFLAELAKALEAKIIPDSVPPADRLGFEAAILGTQLSRQAGPVQLAGSFTSNPPGTWIATKVFVAGGEGEFYLNLNPTEGRGEVSIKDEAYGNTIVREWAKILLAKPDG